MACSGQSCIGARRKTIALGSGERIPRSDNADLATLHHVETLPHGYLFVATAKEHDLTTLAGDMDQATAESLARAMNAQVEMSCARPAIEAAGLRVDPHRRAARRCRTSP